MSNKKPKIIDGDGHVVEDHSAIAGRMSEIYRDRFGSGRSPYPPNDHLHAANAHYLPPGAFAKVGREGWIDFMEDVGLASAVLYPTNGLSFGRIVSLDWAIELARAYNDWMHDEYLSKSRRFQALGLIPLQEPAEAVKELRRIVKELGFCGAMLPSTGVMGAQNHLGDEKYWPIYEEANRLACCIGIHGGVHDHMGLDDMTPYAPVNALGHPFGQMVNFAGMLFNGVFDKYPKVRFGFMEAGAGWVPYWMERLDEHYEYLQPTVPWLTKPPSEYMRGGQLYYAFEMEEKTLPYVAEFVGAEQLIFASDYNHSDSKFPHTVEEVMERKDLSNELKTKLMGENAARLYNL